MLVSIRHRQIVHRTFYSAANILPVSIRLKFFWSMRYRVDLTFSAAINSYHIT